MLRIDAIDAGYGRAQVLREFSLSVESGEILCLLGRNGAGKTTVMKAVMGLAAADVGARDCWTGPNSAACPPTRCRAPGSATSRRGGGSSRG